MPIAVHLMGCLGPRLEIFCCRGVAEGLRRTGVEVIGLSKLCHTRAISAVLSVVWPRPYAGMFTRGEQTVGKWRFVVSAVYPRCTIPENDKVNIAL